MLPKLLTTLLTTVAVVLPCVAQGGDADGDGPEALQLVEAFHARAYDPVADGLESLSFDVELPSAMPGFSMGVLSVHWQKDAELTSRFELSDAMKKMVPEAEHGALQEQLAESGGHLARVQTGQPRMPLGKLDFERAGVEDGLIKVACAPRADADDPDLRESMLFYDGQGRLAKRIETVTRSAGEVEITTTFTWAEAKAAEGKLLLVTQRETSAVQVTNTELTHREFGDFLFVATLAETSGTEPLVVTFSNFVVNGEPLAGEELGTAGTDDEL